MNILVTAIGSMSAECVITRLKASNHFVIGCDIYPGEWHSETNLCNRFYQAPYATDKKQYIDFLLNVCSNELVDYIIPLTDLEIDVINEYRSLFDEYSIKLCMPSKKVLSIARNKYLLFKTFENDRLVPSIPTFLLSESVDSLSYPCVAKPYDGRSSEGLLYLQKKEQLDLIKNKDKYIIQNKVEGPIYTVDYIRNSHSKVDMAIPRIELLRTKNGAGLTVEIVQRNELMNLVSYIGNRLDINGCINMEFIENKGKFYLIDINPRFSAGVAFSVLSGYDMVNNHLNCFTEVDIDAPIQYLEKIMIKKYQEVVI